MLSEVKRFEAGMIFGEIVIDKSYYEFYPELLGFIQRHYENVESGVQGEPAFIQTLRELMPHHWG